MAESLLAPFLTQLALRVKGNGIKVGSYPAFKNGVTVSLVGQNVELVKQIGQEASDIHNDNEAWTNFLRVSRSLKS